MIEFTFGPTDQGLHPTIIAAAIAAIAALIASIVSAVTAGRSRALEKTLARNTALSSKLEKIVISASAASALAIDASSDKNVDLTQLYQSLLQLEYLMTDDTLKDRIRQFRDDVSKHRFHPTLVKGFNELISDTLVNLQKQLGVQ